MRLDTVDLLILAHYRDRTVSVTNIRDHFSNSLKFFLAVLAAFIVCFNLVFYFKTK